MEWDLSKVSVRGKPAEQEWDLSKVSVSSRKSSDYTKMYNAVGFNTLGNDLKTTADAVQKAYTGWQNSETMKATKKQVENMQKRLNAYNQFKVRYAPDADDLSELTKSYLDISNDWGKLSATYGKYKNADEYKNKYEKAQAEIKLREEKNNRNLDDYQVEIDDLSVKLKKAEELRKTLALTKNKYQRSRNGAGKEKITAAEKDVTDYLSTLGYESLDELKGALETLRADKKLAERYQALGKLTAPTDVKNQNYDSEYSKYVEKGQKVSYKDVGEKYKQTYGGGIVMTTYTDTKAAAMALHEHINGTKLEGGVYDNYENVERYRFFKSEEFEKLAYFIAKDKENGSNLTEEYLDLMEETLNQRQAYSEFGADLKNKTGIELLYSVPAGLNQFSDGVKNLINGEDDYITPSVSQFKSQLVREDLEDDGSMAQFVYDFGTTTANMVPSILASAVSEAVLPGSGAFVGSTLMGASAAGNAYAQALNMGYDKNQARVYSTLVGGSEALLSYAFSGISKLGGTVTGKSIKTIVSGIDNGLLRFAANFGLKAGSEALEEMAQEVLNPLFENIALGYTKNGFDDINWSEVVYSGLMALATTGFFEGPSTIKETRVQTAKIKEAKSKYGSAETLNALIDEGLSTPENSKAVEAANKLKEKLENNKKIKGNEILSLIDANEEAIRTEDKLKIKNAVKERLTELGETGDTDTIARAITKKAIGENLSGAEQNAIKNSKYGIRVANEVDAQNIDSGDYSSYWAEIIETERINAQEYSQSVNKFDSQGNLSQIEEKLLNTLDEELSTAERSMKQRILTNKANREGFVFAANNPSPQNESTKNAAMESGGLENNNTDTVIDLSSDNELSKQIGDLHGAEKYKKIKEYILGILGGKSVRLSDGKDAVVDGRDAKHIASNAGSKKISQISQLKKIIEVAKPVAEENSTKEKKFEYFYYYETFVNDGKETYPIYVNVGKARNDGSYHIYDITQKIRDTAHRVNDVGRPVGNALENGISNNRVTQGEPIVNNNSMQNSENYSESQENDSDGIGLTNPSDREIHRRPTSSEQIAELTQGQKTTRQRHILDVAKKLDEKLRVVYVDNDSEILHGKNGKYVRDTNTIYLAKDLTTLEMYIEVFKHEFVHRLESKQAYQSFKNYLLEKSVAFEDYVRGQLRLIAENAKKSYKNGKRYFESAEAGEQYANRFIELANKGSREEVMQALTDYYHNQFVTDRNIPQKIRESFTKESAEREIVADFSGEVLFKGDKNRDDVAQALADEDTLAIGKIQSSLNFFEEIASDDRRLLQKIIDAIKDFIANLKGLKQNERLVNDLEYIEQRLSRVYHSRDTKKAANNSGEVQYSLNVNAKSELHKALYDMSYRNEILLRDETPSIMLSQKGVKNRPMVMNASHIRENVFTEEEARKLGLKVTEEKHYHGLGEDFFLKIIDGLDNVKEAYRGTKYANMTSRRENYFLLVSEFKDQQGNIINVPVYIEEDAQFNRVFLKTNKIATVFAREDFRSYINNQLKNKNLVRIKNKSNKISEGGVPLTPAYESITLDNSVPHKKTTVNTNLSNEAENYSENVENQDGPFSSGSPMQQARENQRRYESGEISQEEYLEENNRLWEKANETYGTLPQGENADAPISTPAAIKEGKPTERFIRTVIETGKLSEEMVESVEESVLLGNFSYEPISDKSATQTAENAVVNGTAENIWENAVNKGKVLNKNEIAIGERLLADAIENGDTKKVLEVSSELADILTRAGQTVQAARLLKKMTGTGKLVAAQRMVNTLNEDLRTKYGEDRVPVKISEEAANRLVNAKTQNGIEHAYQEILQDVADQMPVTFLDKWNAWRYFAMLCNPRTHIRNIIGNLIFVPTVRVKDAIAAATESVFVKEQNRTKSLVIKKEFIDFAKNDGKRDDVKALLKGTKYNDKTALKEKQQIFKTKALEYLTSLNGDLLEAEDILFKNKHYIHALAGYLQARKVNLENVSSSVLDEARIYAINEAKKATFNDESALANLIQNMRIKDHPGLNFAIDLAVEGVLPFKRTPINIIKRGVEYSPIGLGKTLSKGIYDVVKGKTIATEFIDGLASGLTGTGIMLVGVFLANLGFVSGGDDDDKESKFEKFLGKQEYAIEIFGKSYTVDWAAPASIPFFIGVGLVETLKEGEALELSDVGNVVWNSLEPITNLSMLSGIQGVIESARYAEPSQILSAMAGDVLTSYAMQGVPSLMGGISRTIDPTQRSWYTDKNSKWFDSFSQSVINNVKSKIPGLSYTQAPKIDAWGREVTRGKLGERVLENFISPGYYSELEYDNVSEELKRLHKETEGNVFPTTAPKSFKVNGETKQLTANEYVTYAKAKGEYSFDYIYDFVGSKEYKKLTDAQKTKVIENLYKYANAKAKTLVSEYDLFADNSDFKVVARWEKNGVSPIDYYVRQARKK